MAEEIDSVTFRNTTVKKFLSTGSGIAGLVVTEGESIIIKNPVRDERFNDLFDLKTHGMGLVSVPIISPFTGSPIGVVQVAQSIGSVVPGRALTPEERRAEQEALSSVTDMAAQAAITFETFQIVEAEREVLEHERAIAIQDNKKVLMRLFHRWRAEREAAEGFEKAKAALNKQTVEKDCHKVADRITSVIFAKQLALEAEIKAREKREKMIRRQKLEAEKKQQQLNEAIKKAEDARKRRESEAKKREEANANRGRGRGGRGRGRGSGGRGRGGGGRGRGRGRGGAAVSAKNQNEDISILEREASAEEIKAATKLQAMQRETHARGDARRGGARGRGRGRGGGLQAGSTRGYGRGGGRGRWAWWTGRCRRPKTGHLNPEREAKRKSRLSLSCNVENTRAR